MDYQLLYLMRKAKISQQEICRQVGFSPLTFQRKIDGVRDFKLKECIKIKDILNEKLGTKYTIEEIFIIKEE